MFVDSPVEQTTAMTDLMLALQSVGAIVMLSRFRVRQPMWTSVWTWFFGLLTLASFLGAVSHGVECQQSIQNAIWTIVYLALGLVMALFAVAAVTMTWNDLLARRCVPYFMVIAFCFFAVTQIWSDSFLLFVIYEAIAMLVSLALYSACLWSRRKPGSAFLAAGIVVGIAAAIVDTQSSLQMKLIWTFDNHGLFHIVQMLSLLLISIGIYISHLAPSKRRTCNDEFMPDALC